MATKQKADVIQEGRDFFRRLIKEGPWAPVYILSGPEDFLVTEALDRLMRHVFPNGPDDFNFASFDAREASAADVSAACEMVPMFADRRVVRLRNFDAWKANDLATMHAYLEQPMESTLLIIDGDPPPATTKVGKAIRDASSIVHIRFESMNASDTANWVGRRGKSHHRLLIRRDLAAHIVENVGESLETLDRALERLSLYIGGGDDREPAVVTQEMIDEVIVDSRTRSIFDMTRALTQRDIETAVHIYRRMRLYGDSSIGAVSMIAREFRGILLAQEASREGRSDSQLASLLGCPPWSVKNFRQHARSFQRQELHHILEAITDTAAKLTSSRLDDELHVERLMLRICARPSRG